MTAAVLRHGDTGSIEARWGVRKIVLQSDEMFSEAGVRVDGATLVTAAAVVHNPWVGDPTSSDLQGPVREIAPRLAKLLTDRILERAGGAGRIEAFGKGAIIGVDGELEHGAALIHTPFYANLVREFLDGDTVIAYADSRADAGTALSVPLGRKNAGPTRNHFQTASVRIPDAPRADEIVIIAAASTGTRPFPRSGDRSTDPHVIATDLEGVFQ